MLSRIIEGETERRYNSCDVEQKSESTTGFLVLYKLTIPMGARRTSHRE